MNEAYDGVVTIIQQSASLPRFYEERFKLILEETRKAKQAATGTDLLTARVLGETTTPTRGSNYGSPTITPR